MGQSVCYELLYMFMSILLIINYNANTLLGDESN